MIRHALRSTPEDRPPALRSAPDDGSTHILPGPPPPARPQAETADLGALSDTARLHRRRTGQHEPDEGGDAFVAVAGQHDVGGAQGVLVGVLDSGGEPGRAQKARTSGSDLRPQTSDLSTAQAKRLV
jgi:hypothetical protein